MSGEKRALFDVPVDGTAIRCVMRMTARGEVYKISPVFPDSVANVSRYQQLVDIADMLNALIHGGVPWEALATCKNSASLIGALIEAGDAQREAVLRKERVATLQGGASA